MWSAVNSLYAVLIIEQIFLQLLEGELERDYEKEDFFVFSLTSPQKHIGRLSPVIEVADAGKAHGTKMSRTRV